MERPQYLASLRADTERVTAAAQLDLSASVPACAPWTLGELVVHLGRINRWATEIVAGGASERPKMAARPLEGADLSAWYAQGAAAMLDTLASVDESAPVWTLGGPGVAGFWVRRQTQETAVHRWDAEDAAGEAAPIDPAVAVDGIDELLLLFAPFINPKGNGETVHLHATDVEGEWLVRFAPGGLEVERGHSKGDVALKGTASDLLLFAWNRIPADRIEIHGDPAVAATWRDRLSI